MTAREISDSVKKATVAVITRRADSSPQHPFKIIGSGFCVHPAGIVLSANHVFQSFVKDQHHKSVLERVGEGVHVPPRSRYSASSFMAERMAPRSSCMRRFLLRLASSTISISPF